jgi:hypothetical protein
MGGFDVGETAGGFGRKEFEQAAVEFQRMLDVRRGSDARCERQCRVLRGLQHAGIHAGRDCEFGSGFFHLLDLHGGKDCACSGEHFGNFSTDAAQGSESGWGAEGQFHDIDSSGKQGLGKGRSVFFPVDDKHGDDACGFDAGSERRGDHGRIRRFFRRAANVILARLGQPASAFSFW